MQIIDAKLRVRHDSTMYRLSQQYPNSRMLLWCNGNTDVLQVSAGGVDSLDAVMESLKEVASIKEMMKEKGSAVTMVRTCACDGEYLPEIVEKAGCLAIGSRTFTGGWEMLRLFAPDKAALRECVARLKLYGEVDIASMKERNESGALTDMGIAPLPFLGGLTDKQIEVLVSAHEHGLLSVPAKTRMEVVAKKMGLSRSTYGEHLRKAMQRLVENSYPVLKLYAHPYANPEKDGEGRNRSGPAGDRNHP
jgi:predicted DNA binding protein